MAEKIIIIGGGIAGLTAGIFAQKYGYTSEIFEAHSIVGGECTGWNREGFHIDNCIHWMTGTNKNTSLYRLWHETDALSDDTQIIYNDTFYTSLVGGRRLSLYSDKEKTRRELLEISPEDKKSINRFINAVKTTECVKMPVDMPLDLMPKGKLMKLGMSMIKGLKPMKKYGPMTVAEFAQGFRSPLIRTLLSDYLPGDFSAFALLASYATITGGNGGIPSGGSLKMAMRMADKYRSLGGVIHTSSPVRTIDIKLGHAQSITLADGTVAKGDYFIPTCDTAVIFGGMLDKKYMPAQLAENYKTMDVHPQFIAAFGVDDKCEFMELNEIFDCEELTAAHTTVKRIGVRNYSYEPSFAPAGKTVLQSSVWQSSEDYVFWETLYTTDKKAYDRKKNETAEQLLLRIEKQYPQLKGKIKVIDVITPYTYNRFTGAYKGAYMNFVYTPQALQQQSMTGLLHGIDNVVLGSQWLQLPGGLPCAASCGKFAVQRIAAGLNTQEP